MPSSKNKPSLGENTTKKTICDSNHQLESRKKIVKLINIDNDNDCDLRKIMSEILNIPKEIIFQNIHLFTKIDHSVLNSLFYLSKIKDRQDIISAVHSLEFVYNFNKGIDEYLKDSSKKTTEN